MELEPAQLGQRVIFVSHLDSDSVLGAEIAHEDRDDESVGFVACHLHETCSAQICSVLDAKVAEELHLEQACRARAGDPWPIAPPGPGSRERFELLVDAFEALLGQAMHFVMENSPHLDESAYRVQRRSRAGSRAARIASSCQGGA